MSRAERMEPTMAGRKSTNPHAAVRSHSSMSLPPLPTLAPTAALTPEPTAAPAVVAIPMIRLPPLRHQQPRRTGQRNLGDPVPTSTHRSTSRSTMSTFRGMKQADIPPQPKPDFTQWATPTALPESVADRMKVNNVASNGKSSRFSSPFRPPKIVLSPSATPGVRKPSPAQRQRLLRSQTYSDLKEFDEEIEEQREYIKTVSDQEFSGKPIPNMVFQQFRQQVCQGSALVDTIRKLPLSKIERCVREYGQRTMGMGSWLNFLSKLVGDDYRRSEGEALFAYFDSAGDCDVEYKELCTGLVTLLSKDGTLVNVLHRVITFLNPHSIRDTRLSIVTRFELVNMVEAIRIVAEGDAKYKRKVDEALDTLLKVFKGNRMGEFSYNNLKEYIKSQPLLVQIISDLKVPRDPALHASFLSQFLRTSDAEEGEKVFKQMKSVKFQRRLQQKPMSPRKTASSLQSPSRGQSVSDLKRGASGATFEEFGVSVASGTVSPRRSQSMANIQPMSPASDVVFTLHNPEEADEFGKPEYFTLKGVLYRRLDDGPPKPVPGVGSPEIVKE